MNLNHVSLKDYLRRISFLIYYDWVPSWRYNNNNPHQRIRFPKDSRFRRVVESNLPLEYREGVNFTNILRATFAPIILRQKVQKAVCETFLHLHFRFELFWRNTIGANGLIKCWWNWLKGDVEQKKGEMSQRRWELISSPSFFMTRLKNNFVVIKKGVKPNLQFEHKTWK